MYLLQTPPTDHYMRPYYLESSKMYKIWPELCAGAIPRHKVMLNQIKNVSGILKLNHKN